MKALFAFGLLLLAAFLGSRFLFRRKKVFLPLRYFFFSGLIYIFFGLFLGEKGLNVLSRAVLEGLSPLINLGLGWVGFLFGFQLEYRYLKRFPRRYVGLSFLQAVFIICFVSAALILILRLVYPFQDRSYLLGMAACLGLLLSLNSPSLLNFFSSEIPRKGKYYHLARFLGSVSGFWGIGGLALMASFLHFPFFEGNLFTKGFVFLVSSTVFPLFVGYLFNFLAAKRVSDHDLLVYLLGSIFFTSGAAAYFNLPSLYLCLIMGATFSNLSGVQERLYPLL